MVKDGTGTADFSTACKNSGSLTVNAGMLVLGGINTYGGVTAINGGTLQLGDGQGNDGWINSTGGVTDNAALVYNLLGSQSPTYVISGSGSLTMIGGQVTLSLINTYSGGTIVAGGVLQIGNSAALGSGGTAANGGALDLAGFSLTTPSFSGAGYPLAGGVVTTSATGLSTLTVTQSSTTSFGGSIVDGGGQLALKLQGSGEQFSAARILFQAGGGQRGHAGLGPRRHPGQRQRHYQSRRRAGRLDCNNGRDTPLARACSLPAAPIRLPRTSTAR